MVKERIHWIDWSKCLLIYLVVVAHYGQISPLVDNLICAFHMPAFFMISGYLHKAVPVKVSAVKNFKRLIIPALLFSLLCWGVMLVWDFLRDTPFSAEEHIYKPLWGIIRYDRPYVSPPCGVIWFLQVLFICQVFIDLLVKNGKLKYTVIACVICAMATGAWYYYGIDDKQYLFFIQRTCASFPFVALGYMAKQKQMQKLSSFNWLPWLLLTAYVLGVMYNGRVGIASWRFGHNVFLYYAIAITGCFGFYLTVNKIKRGAKYCSISQMGRSSYSVCTG